MKKKMDAIAALYEHKRAALLPILHLIQEAHGFVSDQAEIEVAKYFGIPEADVKEIMTFYTLFRKKSGGKIEFHVCRGSSCQLAGAKNAVEYLKEKLGIGAGEETPDGAFAVREVECLGACEKAPVAAINGKYVGPLTKEVIDQIIRE